MPDVSWDGPKLAVNCKKPFRDGAMEELRLQGAGQSGRAGTQAWRPPWGSASSVFPAEEWSGPAGIYCRELWDSFGNQKCFQACQQSRLQRALQPPGPGTGGGPSSSRHHSFRLQKLSHRSSPLYGLLVFGQTKVDSRKNQPECKSQTDTHKQTDPSSERQ